MRLAQRWTVARVQRLLDDDQGQHIRPPVDCWGAQGGALSLRSGWRPCTALWAPLHGSDGLGVAIPRPSGPQSPPTETFFLRSRVEIQTDAVSLVVAWLLYSYTQSRAKVP